MSVSLCVCKRESMCACMHTHAQTYITLHCLDLPYLTLPYITLHYILSPSYLSFILMRTSLKKERKKYFTFKYTSYDWPREKKILLREKKKKRKEEVPNVTFLKLQLRGKDCSFPSEKLLLFISLSIDLCLDVLFKNVSKKLCLGNGGNSLEPTRIMAIIFFLISGDDRSNQASAARLALDDFSSRVAVNYNVCPELEGWINPTMLSNLKDSFWSAFQLQCTGVRPFHFLIQKQMEHNGCPHLPFFSVICPSAWWTWRPACQTR